MSIPFRVDSLGKSTPAWLCDLNSSLWNILEGGEKNFITEYLPGDSKLVVHTDRIDDEMMTAVTDLLEKVVSQSIEILIVNDLAFIWIDPLNTELTDLLDGSQFETAWLADENTLVVHTDRVDDELLEAVRTTSESYMPAGVTLVQYNHNMEISLRDINKYAECVTKDDMLAVNADYPNDVTSEGEWIYPLTNLNANGIFRSTAGNIKRLVYDAPSLSGLRYDNISGLPNVQEIVVNCPSYVGYVMTGATGRKWNDFVVNCPNLEKITVLALSDDFDNLDRFFYNNPKLKEIELPKLPKLCNASLFCLESQLSKRSVLPFLKEVIINATTGLRDLGLGIHIDHKTDEEVLAAIDAATANGWRLTVRWNGTATASTASTLSLLDEEEEIDPIYARIVEEPERGDYVTPEGTRVIIDWGHLITSPDGKTPEEMGYEQYVSIGEVMYKHNLSYYTE